MIASDNHPATDECRQETGLDIPLGLLSAFGFGVIGFVATSILLGVMGDNLFPNQILFPATGITFILAATGWATFAPRGKYNFTWTLALIFLLTVASWCIIGPFISSMPKAKVSDAPIHHLRFFFFLSVPPLAIALIISLIRSGKRQGKVSE